MADLDKFFTERRAKIDKEAAKKSDRLAQEKAAILAKEHADTLISSRAPEEYQRIQDEVWRLAEQYAAQGFNTKLDRVRFGEVELSFQNASPGGGNFSGSVFFTCLEPGKALPRDKMTVVLEASTWNGQLTWAMTPHDRALPVPTEEAARLILKLLTEAADSVAAA